MTAVLRDLWPDDIKSDDVISPEEILEFQADQLEKRTNGLLAAHVPKHYAEDRVIIGFEVEATRGSRRARLFEVNHRLDFEYPVAIIPPGEELPDYLKERAYRPSVGEAIATAFDVSKQAMTVPGSWIENEWVATSPTEFSEKVERVLATPVVKAIVLSLLAGANRDQPDDGVTDQTPKR